MSLFFALFFLLGLAVGCLGTIMGIGGGIVLIPVLLAIYPELAPDQITSMSLFCVAINSTVGSISYLRKKKVHIPSAILFSLASLPGAWLGVQLIHKIDRPTYELSFGIFLFIMGIYLFVKKPRSSHNSDMKDWQATRKKYILGTLGSFAVGLFASLLGLGGGIIHVPMMIELMHFPVHVAVATSHSILSVSTTLASVEHYMNGTLDFSKPAVLFIAGGILIGAPIGAKISSRIKGTTIVKMLGGALIIVAIRLILRA